MADGRRLIYLFPAHAQRIWPSLTKRLVSRPWRYREIRLRTAIAPDVQKTANEHDWLYDHHSTISGLTFGLAIRNLFFNHRFMEAEPMHTPPQKPESLAEKAYLALDELIVTLKLPPGSIWSEGSLSDLVKIGRTPVREAIKRLEGAYLIEVVPRHGVKISKIDLFEQMQVVEFRRGLEHLISGCAAKRASPEEREQLIAMAHVIEKAGAERDLLTYLRKVFSANQYISACARNPFASRAIAPLHGLSRRFYYKYHIELKNLKEVGILHANRARAVALGDEREAEAASNRLMDCIGAYTKDIYVKKVGI
jgi:DNA-binding GntR family transcriptional regulator